MVFIHSLDLRCSDLLLHKQYVWNSHNGLQHDPPKNEEEVCSIYDKLKTCQEMATDPWSYIPFTNKIDHAIRNTLYDIILIDVYVDWKGLYKTLSEMDLKMPKLQHRLLARLVSFLVCRMLDTETRQNANPGLWSRLSTTNRRRSKETTSIDNNEPLTCTWWAFVLDSLLKFYFGKEADDEAAFLWDNSLDELEFIYWQD